MASSNVAVLLSRNGQKKSDQRVSIRCEKKSASGVPLQTSGGTPWNWLSKCRSKRALKVFPARVHLDVEVIGEIKLF